MKRNYAISLAGILLLVTMILLSGCTATVESTVREPARARTADAGPIDEEGAVAIALEHAGFSRDQVIRLRVDFEKDDGTEQYDVEFVREGYEYEYEIHAGTGRILSFDKDRED